LSYNYKRTLIILAIALALFICGSFFSFSRIKKAIKKVQAETIEIDQKIGQIPNLQIEMENCENVIDNCKAKLSQLDKTVEPQLTASNTYSYLDSVQDRFGFLECSITFEEDSVLTDYSYIGFTVKGKSFFDTIYNFIWALEKGPKIFHIKKFDLRGLECLNDTTGETEVIVNFELKIWAIYSNLQELPPINNRLDSVEYQFVEVNPFYPYIASIITPNIDGLPEIEKSELIAVLQDRILISDGQRNILEMQVGDAVYLGYLTKIDAYAKSAEFVLNKGGIMSTYILSLSFNGKVKP
jgi:hypothetical protein